ncbi:hypothetical protein SDC9_164889 [bioreactor metagenome]|uniref:Uncharacterized protein n=1 Tax=bioreactor metagenome TaxID=1076179 RepID=A0A645FSV2_9ZZZZ
MFFLLRPADTVKHFLEYRQVGADGFGNFVEKTAGVDVARIGLNLDLFFAEPVNDGAVLQLAGQNVCVAQVNVGQRGDGCRYGGRRGAFCRCGRFQADDFLLRVEVSVE